VITPADLRSPVGPLEDGFLPDTPGDPLVVRLQTYITEGENKVSSHPGTVADPEEAVKAWALYRAFDATFMIKSHSPASASMQDLGSQAFNKEQILAFREKAMEYLAMFLELVPPMAEGPSISRRLMGTRSIRRQLEW